MRPVQAAVSWLLPALALKAALAMPSHAHPTPISSVAESKDVSVRLSIPCNECAPVEEGDLILSLQLQAGHSKCAADHLSINGDVLKQVWDGSKGVGSGTLRTTLSESLLEHEIHAEWQSKCILNEQVGHEVQLISIALGPEKEANSSHIAGLTLSFVPGSEPVILRVVPQVLDIPSDNELLLQWLRPSVDDPFAFPLASQHPTDSALETKLQTELHELRKLKQQIFELHHEIKRKKKDVRHLLGQDLISFGSKLSECDSFRCLWNHVITKVPEVAETVTSYFQHPIHEPSHDRKPEFPHNIHGDGTSTHHKHPGPASHGDAPPPPPPPAFFDEDIVGDEFVPVEHEGHDSIVPRPHDDEPRPESHSPPPHHGGPPPPPPPPPEGHHLSPHHGDGPPPLHMSYDEEHSPEARPPPPHEHGHGHRHGPGPHHARGHMITIVPIVVTVLVFALAFSLVRRRFLSPQRQADNAFRREERRTLRAYRRAARRHKWSQWWSRYRNPNSSADYEEKRLYIVSQEGVLEDIMQAEIRDLQRAHELVGEMVRAHESRDRMYRLVNTPAHAGGLTPAELEAGIPSSSSNHDLDLPPPRYSEELEGDIRVVDGFMFTPSATDETPESSVIDCSPRLSLDTSRTRASSNATKDDAHNMV